MITSDIEIEKYFISKGGDRWIRDKFTRFSSDMVKIK